MKNDSIIKIWSDYCSKNLDAPENYDVWAFGDSKDMADELAGLVLEGVKTATASLYLLYEREKEALPYAGLHNIILNGAGKAVGIIETTEVNVVPFNEVTAEFAYLEGEGDRSLAYWRDVHEAFFKRELEEIGIVFNWTMHVVCEKFRLIDKEY